MASSALVRFGAMGEVARFRVSIKELTIGTEVIVQTERGEEFGTVIRVTDASDSTESEAMTVRRVATGADRERLGQRRSECENEFTVWQHRIREWHVDLELVDLERTLDGQKLILYVLNDRGPETTKLALRAAAAGHGVIEVQPVGPEGLIPVSAAGGCGNCGQK